MAPASESDYLAFGANDPICPYTGLRTFTEEEAIYFRGREGHVGNCLALLAEQHFVMVTGASGDGKSSLVFAGMLPEVRAGFVRARYGNWAVATFRPERSPLRNLAQALAGALRLPDHADTVQTELQQGFSALVQLYEASALCPPAPSDPALPPAELRRQQRQAANLLLVVDQFEEFFTNPENYEGTAPNAAAQTTVNLLLETARLARARELPIYIVCTMRSDFVGQCAEFRGLIEQVGASQYFVPRLLRHEFVQVIRDPAELSGNRISERLVQRLVLDASQGQDQLPVLQHALRRIWLAASHGREQLDLIHYAMVGGLDGELPAEDRARFTAWQATLPAGERQFLLGQPSLRNVLDAHASQLYAQAGALYNRDFTPALPSGTAERVIEQTFRVLTRTDGKRVVRNRLTGAEITAILDDEALPWPVVCRVLQPFRQPDATFLLPFIAEGDDPPAVPPADTVLDITHESLIRNWRQLSAWAADEARDVRLATNLLQEATRWQENGESKGFLLPIGLYSVFAQWAENKRGLTAWLAYYYNPGADPAQRLPQAEQQHALLARYLEASRRRLRAQLLLARYGVRRLVLAVVLPLLLGGLAWTGWKWRQRQDDYVAYSIVEQRAPLLTSSFVPVHDKARFLLAADRLGGVAYQPWLGGRSPAAYAFPRMLDALHNDTLAIGIELSMFSAVDIGSLGYDSVERDNPAALRLLRDLTRRLDQASQSAPPAGRPALGKRERALAVFTARTVMALTLYQLSSETRRVGRPRPPAERRAVLDTVAAARQRLLGRLLAYARAEVQATTDPAPSPVAFSFCLRVLLGQGTFQPEELAFLQEINPFGAVVARRQFARLYPAGHYLYNEYGGYLDHGGGYLTAAIGLAALHQPAQVLQCLAHLRQDAVNIREGDGAFVLLPYLVKYELLTPANVYPLLSACSRVGGLSLNETYAVLVYSLLSERPGNLTHDVSQPPSPIILNQLEGVQLGSVNPAALNIDRVSYSIPLASRDRAWQAVLTAVPAIAAYAAVFSTQDALGSAMKTSALQATTLMHWNVADAPKGNEYLFVQAFANNLHGIYLSAFKHQSGVAAQAFGVAAAATAELREALQQSASMQHLEQYGTDVQQQYRTRINPAQWNLGFNQNAPGQDSQDPVDFLRQPSRPKTREFGGYYTCAFDALFVDELRRATTGHRPDTLLVRQLDSLAFVEAIFPDRFSRTRTRSLWAEALSRPPQFQPNLVWLRAVARYQVSGDTLRRRRNAVLLAVSAALQSSPRLARVQLTPGLRTFVQQLPKGRYYYYPLQVLFSNLAVALAHAGRVADGFALAGLLDNWDATPTKLRLTEQMLLNGQTSQPSLADSFLLAYGKRVRRKPTVTPLNAFALFYSRGYLPTPSATRLAEEVDVPYLFCERAIGFSLAGQSYLAVREAPTNLPERLRQVYFNCILLSLAHLHTDSSADGWHEYDHSVLSGPIPGTPDYIGPLE